MYRFWKEQLEIQFENLLTLKETPRKTTRLIRHKKSGKRFVLCTLKGSGDIYRKLISVSSPYLPRVYEAAEENGEVLVLEEYLEGDALDEMLENACFSPNETRQIAMDICKALYTLHSLNIIHRDVKPENIKLRGHQAVLLDFDASRLQKTQQVTDTIPLGTTGYAAPEQFGLSQTDGRADIYALGVTMNLMLTGTHPSVRMAPGRLGRIISHCTMMQPDKRYQNVKQLMEALSV